MWSDSRDYGPKKLFFIFMIKKIFQTETFGQSGFAIIELLVVTGILSILMSISLTSINPGKQLTAARNVQIQSDELAIIDAIYEYEAENGGFEPPSIASVTSTPEPLAMNVNGAINVCPDLVPLYLAELPIAPLAGTITGGSNACDSTTTSYNTGYVITQSKDRRITVATNGENSTVIISETR
jgi:prepilin-type N-terminal cleavage/methylation domain-containing protein